MAETKKRSAQRTRERILQAAMLHFSQHSYEGTKLRDIAGSAGVDVALVHRSFGSKEELFASTLEAAFDSRFDEALDAPDPAVSLAALFFAPRLDPKLGLIDPMDIVVRSLGHERAGPVLRDFVRLRFSTHLTEKLGPAQPERVAMILACFGGLAVFDDILSIGRLDRSGRDRLRSLLEQILRLCLEGGEKCGALASSGEARHEA
ncbi:TetR family transcriptional regulator [Bosea sp. RAF48]|uniref:TetR family transcriptional regulator n=1 Tax=Bosea sp. RAF48 TaxID=3237480 RepID=UPI003F934D58